MQRTQLLFQSNLQNYRKTFYSTYNSTIDVDHAHKWIKTESDVKLKSARVRRRASSTQQNLFSITKERENEAWRSSIEPNNSITMDLIEKNKWGHEWVGQLCECRTKRVTLWVRAVHRMILLILLVYLFICLSVCLHIIMT